MDFNAAFASMDTRSLAVMVVGWIALCALLAVTWRRQHGAHWGAANTVTFARAIMTIALAGLSAEVGWPGNLFSSASGIAWTWVVTVVATVALSLDGVDGMLARARGESSRFGARFDMETDAFLALVLAVFIWRSGELGVWVLLLGSLRYVFVVASWYLPALRADLYPSFRRKLVCVIQIAALCLIVSPVINGTLSLITGAIATVALTGSFLVDVAWLLRRQPATA